MAHVLFKNWFVDFEPFADGKFIDSELGEIPVGWRVGDIYSLMAVIYGAPFQSSLFNDQRNGYPLIRIRDLKTFSPQFFTTEILPKMEVVTMGDILVGMDAEFRPCIWQGAVGVLNQRVCKIRSTHNCVCRFFIYETLKPHLELIEHYKTGTTVSHIGKADLDKIRILIPPDKVLQAYADIAEPLYLQILNNSNENMHLVETRDTLLPRLMSGKLSVVNL